VGAHVTQMAERSQDSAVIAMRDALDPLFAYGFGLSYNDTNTLGDSLPFASVR
jgi:hypothetical protein